MPDTKTNSAIPTLPISAMKPVSAKTPTRTHKSTTHPKSFQHPNDYIVMPAAQDHSQDTTFSATKSFLDTPSWLKIVCELRLRNRIVHITEESWRHARGRVGC